MISVKLRRKGSNRNKIIFITLGVMYALAITVFAWFGVQNIEYRTQFAKYSQELGVVVGAAPEVFKQFKEAPDVTTHTAALKSLAATVSQKVEEAPSAPSFWGFGLGTDSERAKMSRIRAAAHAFTTKLKEEATFVTYQSQIAHNLQALSLKNAGNHAQIVALAAEWQRSIEYIEQFPTPVKLKEFSATLVQKMASIQVVVAQLAELYKANDEAGFIAKQKELASAVADLKPLAEQITAASKALDAELAEAFAILRQNL